VLTVQASAFTEANIVDVGSYEDLKAAVAERKWARGPWAGAPVLIHSVNTLVNIVMAPVKMVFGLISPYQGLHDSALLVGLYCPCH